MPTETSQVATRKKNDSYAVFAGILLVTLLTFGVLHNFGVFR